MTVAAIDLRVGGRWRWVMVTDDGYEAGFHGEYREIVPNQRIVNSEAFERFPEPDAYSVNTMTLIEHDGRTTMTVLVEHQRPEYRDAHINSGLEAGMQDAYDLLEEAATALVGPRAFHPPPLRGAVLPCSPRQRLSLSRLA